MVNILQLTSEAKVLIAAPARPMAKEVADGISKLVACYPQVVEAHLPYCMIFDVMEQPAQILALTTKTMAEFQQVSQEIATRLPNVLPSVMALTIIFAEKESTFLEKVRGVRCRIYAR